MASKSMTRKSFLKVSVGGIAAMGIAGCPSDDTDGDTEASGTDTPTTSTSTSTSGTTSTSTSTSTGSSTTEDTGSSSGDPQTTGMTSGSGSTGTGTGSESGSESGSGSGSTSTGEALCPDGAASTDVSGDPTHNLVIPAGSLVAGTPLMGLSAQGTSKHDHRVDLTADDVDTLLGGGTVMVESGPGPGAHTHTVTITCS